MERIQRKTSSGKGYELSSKEDRGSDKDCIHLNTILKGGQLQFQHSRLLFTDRSNETRISH